jgi:hypothetical protein
VTRPVLPAGELSEVARLALGQKRASSALQLATKPKVPTEHDEQVRLVAWAAWAAGDVLRAAEASGNPALLDQFVRDYGAEEQGRHRALRGLVAVANEGRHGSAALGGRAKAEGLRIGYPDLLLDVARIVQGVPYFGLRLELKRTKGGKLSTEQVVWGSRLEKAGYYVTTEYGMEAARRLLLEYVTAPPLLRSHFQPPQP